VAKKNKPNNIPDHCYWSHTANLPSNAINYQLFYKVIISNDLLKRYQGMSEEHSTLASSMCVQLWTPHPLWLQSEICASLPEQSTLSSQIRPVPCPSVPLLVADGKPSCLQTTLASFISQLSSQTVPHSPPAKTSTLPVDGVLPISRIELTTA